MPMSRRLKISLITIIIIAVITIIKFVFYYFSGSMAVLSESLHSFSDVATTLLVMIAIYRQQKKELKSPVLRDFDTDSEKGRLFSIYKKIRNIDTEIKASILISILLVGVSVSLFLGTLFSGVVKVENALSTGIIFIVLSVFSYFLYRFQISAAEEEKSAALKADGLHTKADMLISMITGISLLLYYAGFNLDRYFAAGISLYIFQFSIRLFISSIRQSIGYNSSFLDTLSGFQCFNCGFFIKLKKYSVSAFRIAISLSVAAGIIYYLSTSIYIVNVNEEALLFRFGRLVNKDSGIKPGIHFCFPKPVDDIVFVKTGNIFSINIGNENVKKNAKIWTQEHGDSIDYISGDNNFFLPYISLHYKIEDPVKYYSAFQTGSLRKIIQNTTDNVLNTLFSQSDFYDISIHKKRDIVAHAKERVQNELDNYNGGVEITGLFFIDIHPPTVIASSFEGVVASLQIKEKYLQDAYIYFNKKIPQTRVKSLQIIAQAEKYKTEKINTASGESESHLLKLDSYRSAGKVAKDIILLQAAEKTFSDRKKVIVDPDTGIDPDILYYENYMMKRK